MIDSADTDRFHGIMHTYRGACATEPLTRLKTAAHISPLIAVHESVLGQIPIKRQTTFFTPK